MNELFKALADPTRRNMLDRLFERQGLTLSELVEGTQMKRQSATRHVKLLEKAGLVVSVRSGREKLHYLNPIPIAEVSDRWIDKFSRRRAGAVSALKKALQEQDHDKS